MGPKAVCPFCDKNDLWGSDYVIKEHGKTLFSWNNRTTQHSIVEVFYVRSCKQCFKRRVRYAKGIRWLVVLLFVCSGATMLLSLISHFFNINNTWVNMAIVIGFAGMIVAPVLLVLYMTIYTLYNRLHHRKWSVSKECAERHNALFTTAPRNQQTVNPNPIDPLNFLGFSHKMFEDEAGLTGNPHFFAG